MYVTQYEWVWTVYGYRLVPVQRWVPVVYHFAPAYFVPQHLAVSGYGVER